MGYVYVLAISFSLFAGWQLTKALICERRKINNNFEGNLCPFIFWYGNTCPYLQRLRVVLFEKGMDLEIRDNRPL